jgi:predicted HTH domain antitoxin
LATKVTLEVPEGISAQARQKALEAAVLALWEAGELSASRAAEELGLSAHEFLDLLAAKGLPILRDFDPAAVQSAERKLSAPDQA